MRTTSLARLLPVGTALLFGLSMVAACGASPSGPTEGDAGVPDAATIEGGVDIGAGGAYRIEGTATLDEGRERQESFGLFVDATGTPTHVYDARWRELHELHFAPGAGLSDDFCADAECDWRVERDTGCARLEYDRYFRVGYPDDTGYAYSGSMRLCPSGGYERSVQARGQHHEPTLAPGEALVVEANYPLDETQDRFEILVDGVAATVTPARVAPNRWEYAAAVPMGASLEVRATGPRGIDPSRSPTTLSTTSEISDLTFATPPADGALDARGIELQHDGTAMTGSSYSFTPITVGIALGDPGGATALRASIRSTYAPGVEQALFVARGDGARGSAELGVGSADAVVDREVEIPVGTGPIWLVLQYRPPGHPYATEVQIELHEIELISAP